MVPSSPLIVRGGFLKRVYYALVSRPSVAAFAALFVLASAATAGSLTPPGSPSGTMFTLSQIFGAIASSFDSSSVVANQNGNLIEHLKYIEDNLGWASSSNNLSYIGSGNVGIGDSTPEANFEVSGTASVSFLTVNGSPVTGIGSDSLDFDEFVDSMTLDANTSVASNGFRLGLDAQGTTPASLLSLGRNPFSQGFIAGSALTPRLISAVKRVTGTPTTTGLFQTVWDLPAGGGGLSGVVFITQTASSSAQNMTGSLTGLFGVSEHVGTGTANSLIGTYAIASKRNTGGVADQRALLAQTGSFAAGTVSNSYNVYAQPSSLTAGTVSNMYNFYSGRVSFLSGGAMTSHAGFATQHLTQATNNTAILIGSTSGSINIPAGNFGFYNASPYSNYIAGNVGIGTTNVDALFELAGFASISGSASLSGNFELSGFMASNLTPRTTNTFSLGTSALRWSNLFAIAASVSSTLEVNNLIVSGSFTPSAYGSVSQNWDPSADNIYSLGGTSSRWKDIFLGPGSLHISSTTGTSGAGSNYTDAVLQFTSGSSLSLGTSAFGTGASGSLAFGTGVGNTTRLYISGRGNVGIGSTNPGAKLQVKGGGLLTESLILASSSNATLVPAVGFQGFTMFTGGVGTGGRDSSTLMPTLHLTAAGDLVNIGLVQAGQTLLTKSGTFAAKVDYTVIGSPNSVALADLNGDGRNDIVALGIGTDAFSVVLSSSSGTFQTHSTYTTGDQPHGMAIAELNGDGWLDIVVANDLSETMSVYFNNRDGTFSAKVDYPTGVSPRYVALGDVNGDGKADIAVTNSTSLTVSLYLNRGNGTFYPKIDYSTGSTAQGVAMADVNGDGKLDIIAANFSTGTAAVLMNNGGGTFAAVVGYTTGTMPRGIAVADVSGDGKPDIVTANTGASTVSVLINNGTGTFAAKVDYATGLSPYGQVALADLNGDGRADIVTPNSGASTISVLMNNGSGTFAAKVDYATATTTRGVAVGDLNGDGKADIVAANSSGSSVSVFMNRTSAMLYAQASTGNVGIGTLTPTAAFDITPTSSYSGLLFRVASGSNERFSITSAGHASLSGNFELSGFMASNLTPRTTNTFSLGTSALRWSNLFAVNASISSTLEVNNLIVSGSFTPSAYGSVSQNWDPVGNALYDLGGTDNRWRDLYLASGSLHIGTSGDEAVIDYNVNDDYLAFKPDGSTNGMVITDGGNIGIGTDTPDKSLDVNGYVMSSSSFAFFRLHGSTFGAQNDDNQYTWGAGGATERLDLFNGAGTTLMSIASGGQIGIGAIPGTQDTALVVQRDQDFPSRIYAVNANGGSNAQAGFIATDNSSTAVRLEFTPDTGSSFGMFTPDTAQLYTDTNTSGGLAMGTAGGHRIRFFTSSINERMRIDTAGGVSIANALNVGGIATVSYSRFGTGTTDHSLSSADDLLISGFLEVDDDTFIDADASLSGNFELSGFMASNLTPRTTNTFSLGTSALRWSNLFATNASISNSLEASTASVSLLYIGGTQFSGRGVTSNSLDFDEFVDSMTLDATTSIASNGFKFALDPQGYTPPSLFTLGRKQMVQGFYSAGTGDPSLFSATKHYTGSSFQLSGAFQTVWDMPAGGGGISNFTFINQTASSSAQNMTSTLTGLTAVSEHVGTGVATGLTGLSAIASKRNTGGVITQRAITAGTSNFAAGTVSNSYNVFAQPGSFTAGTVSSLYNLYSARASFISGGTITSLAGIATEHLTQATNNTALLIASTSGSINIPAGNFGFYNASPFTNYIAGNVGIASVSPQFKLAVEGSFAASSSFGSGLSSCSGGTSKLLWSAVGLFSCGTDQTSSGGTLALREGYAGAFTNASSISFSPSAFNVNFSDSHASVSLDWVNGPASRSIAQTITGLWTFGAGASFGASAGPTVTNLYDLGSQALRWRSIYVSSGSVHIGMQGNEATIDYDSTGADDALVLNGFRIYDSGNASVSGNVETTGNITTSGNITVLGSIISTAGTNTLSNASVSSNFEVSGIASVSGTLFANSVLSVLGPASFVDASVSGRFELTSALSRLGINAGGGTDSSLEVGGTASISGTTTLRGVSYTWPSAVGGSGNFLANDGTGALSWASASVTVRAEESQAVILNSANRFNFDGGKFTLTASGTTEISVNLDWGAGGPASRSAVNTWTGQNTFSAGVSVSSNLETIGTASISGAATFNGLAAFAAGASFSQNLELTSALARLGINAGGATTTTLEVGGTASISGMLSLGDGASASGNVEIAGNASSSRFFGAGLTDCDSKTTRLTWTASGSNAGKFGCATDSADLTMKFGAQNIPANRPAAASTSTGFEFGVFWINTTTTFSVASTANEFATTVNTAGRVRACKLALNAMMTAGAVEIVMVKNGVVQSQREACRSVSTNFTKWGASSVLGPTDWTFVAGDRIAFVASTNAAYAPATRDGALDITFAYDTSADLAEIYYSAEPIPHGVVVALDDSRFAGVRVAGSGDRDRVVGVVSQIPGLLLGSEAGPGEPVKVALSGRIPVYVSTENGSIRSGDWLTLSSIPGVAMRATKSGTVIGQALSDYADASQIGQVMLFVKNAQFTGAAPVDAQGERLSGRDLLVRLSEGTAELASISSSEMFADRLAGLEVVAHSVSANRLLVGEILTASGSAAIALDDEGNAVFAGTVTAPNITALSEELQVARELLAQSLEAGVTIAQSLLTLESRIASSEGLLGGLTERIGALEAGLASGGGTLDGGALVQGVTFSGPVTIAGGLTVADISAAGDAVNFLNDTVFFGRPYFNADTGGFAVIPEGRTEVRITFGEEYLVRPVVGVTLSLDAASASDELEEQLLDSAVRYVVTDKDTTGFTIKLAEPAAVDIPFDWTALAIRDPNTFVPAELAPSATPDPTPEVSPPTGGETSPTPEATPELTGTPEVTPEPTEEPTPESEPVPSEEPQL